MALCYDIIDLKNIKEVYLVFADEINLPFKSFLLDTFTDITLDENTVVVKALPENVSISSKQRDHKNGVYWNIDISFDVSSQDPTRFNPFKQFQNTSVVAVLKTESNAYMYGNAFEPLRFYINEQNPKKLSGLMGYQIKLSGKSTFEMKVIPAADFNVNDFLANTLSKNL